MRTAPAIAICALFVSPMILAAPGASPTDVTFDETLVAEDEGSGSTVRATHREEGANALAGALDRDHDGSILDNLGGFREGEDCGDDEECEEEAQANEAAPVER